jgi:hypothetical protein
MTTLEDIITIYENEGKFYKNFMDTNRVLNKNVVVCELSAHCPSLKNKSYIKLGEECSICFEPIFFHSHSFLGDCGHAFHRKCIYQWEEASFLTCLCPLCRKNLDTFGISQNTKYNTYFYDINFTDKLENFWNNIDYKNKLKYCKYCKKSSYYFYQTPCCEYCKKK